MERGFGAHIKRVANGFRADLGLSLFSPVDLIAACDWLAIPVLAMTDLTEDPRIAGYFGGHASAEFSAVTSFIGTSRFIVYNDCHHHHRQASSIAHELGHALLQHPPAPVLTDDGYRNWNSEIEEQAAFFSGALLVPDEACRWIMKSGMNLSAASLHFGVSTSMVDYRLKKSGATRIHERLAARR
jgi:hypothetical protein